ncbi:hypothetical protein RJ639_013958 [Escallonia herrerae]|uniref:Uncharacterized protein n=1 Tax=Escallonia herrerae TaxID=1293975 RepID=A0AA88VGL9_9ASTE|nr:hypothetical protein RJ639_013958 [Escallonia herrerae]
MGNFIQVDLGSLKDTVPTDRIVVLQGGWGLLKKRSSGEILLRLTYKAYVEDEEDEKTGKVYLESDASDDESYDSEEIGATYEQREKDPSSETNKETFMDVLAALIVSEEFQGIVASETGNTRSLDNATKTISTSKPRGPDAESVLPTEDRVSEGSGDMGKIRGMNDVLLTR